MKNLLFAFLLLTFQVDVYSQPEIQPNTYPYGNDGVCQSSGDPWSMVKNQCTSYCAWRMNEYFDLNPLTSPHIFYNTMTGVNNDGNCNTSSSNQKLSNACRWANRLSSLGYLISSTPTVGAIAHWNGGNYGHVGIVEKVNANGSITVSEYNYSSVCKYGLRSNVNADRYIRFNRFKLEGSVIINPNPIVQNQSINVSISLKNNSNESINNVQVRCALYSSSNQYLGTIEEKTINYLGNQVKNLEFNKSSISTSPGSYKIWIETRLNSNFPWIIVHKHNESSSVGVNIIGGLSCTAPTSISSSNISTNSAQINWQFNSTNTNSITLEYTSNTSYWNSLVLPGNYNYYTLTNLNSNTLYYYRLKRNCTGGTSSSYSSTYIFTTQELPNNIVNEGVYRITRAGTNKVLDVASGGSSGSNVILFNDNNTNNQEWIFKLQSDGSYKILSRYNPILALNDMNNNGSGSIVGMVSQNSSDNQRWIVTLQSDGTYEIIRKGTNLNLNVQNCLDASGSAINIFTDANSNCQRWILTYKFNYQAPGLNSNALYKVTRQGTNKVLDVSGCGGAGSNVTLYDDLNNNCQKWFIQLQSDGAYELKPAFNTALNLDVQNCGNIPGSNVATWYDNNFDCQRWNIIKNTDGTFEMMRQNTVLLLDVANCGTTALSNVQLWSENNLNCQRWVLTIANAFNGDDISSRELDYRDMTVDLTIFPNPAFSFVKVSSPMEKNGEFVIYDLYGNKVKTKTLENEITKIDINDLYPGVYILMHVENDRIVNRKKFIKQ